MIPAGAVTSFAADAGFPPREVWCVHVRRMTPGALYGPVQAEVGRHIYLFDPVVRYAQRFVVLGDRITRKKHGICDHVGSLP